MKSLKAYISQNGIIYVLAQGMCFPVNNSEAEAGTLLHNETVVVSNIFTNRQVKVSVKQCELRLPEESRFTKDCISMEWNDLSRLYDMIGSRTAVLIEDGYHGDFMLAIRGCGTIMFWDLECDDDDELRAGRTEGLNKIFVHGRFDEFKWEVI